ncbi:hypothetical protein SESBI_37902 [Sesbania bispinosa]|nr:hypothetical protein SESBI_37902 [Sesbania bispinosa]
MSSSVERTASTHRRTSTSVKTMNSEIEERVKQQRSKIEKSCVSLYLRNQNRGDDQRQRT